MGKKEKIQVLLKTNPNLSMLSGIFLLIIILSMVLVMIYFFHFMKQRMEENIENTISFLQSRIEDYIELLETTYKIEFIPEFGELAESKGLLGELIDRLNDPLKRMKVLELGIFYHGSPFLSWNLPPSSLNLQSCPSSQKIEGKRLTIIWPLKMEKREFCALITFDISFYLQSLMGFTIFLFLLTLINVFAVVYLSLRALQAEFAKQEAQKKAQAERDLALIGRMASSFAHELRNSLNTIFLQLQAQGISLTQSSIHKEWQRILQWLEDILFFHKEINIKPEQFKAEDLLFEIKMFMAGLSHKKFKFEVSSQVEELWGDKFWLKKALENLLKNAYEALPPEDGLIRLILKQENGNYSLAVFDNGEALTEEDKIFEPFFTKKREGFGLGLYLVKKIVEAHQGEIKIINQPNGKSFIIIWKAR